MASAKYAKRIQKEIEQNKIAHENFEVHPLRDNDKEWHFTLRGVKETPFEGGLFHGKVILPENYPISAPDIYLLTPNGRYTLNTKICLNATSYHQESWSPQWTVTNGEGEISAMNSSDDQKKEFAKESVNWRCEHCGDLKDIAESAWST